MEIIFDFIILCLILHEISKRKGKEDDEGRTGEEKKDDEYGGKCAKRFSTSYFPSLGKLLPT